ncbi:uncharacterized protein L969DRAFT_87766 [Mixia osmundae IAM 14324]|uniref:Nudix hydrolase domain-containing protein n=1 Tax=Mixia osmundae (strain CBS 9802 / IAM 14324 / JCM 22182 / KY 12970) TaxID=764103 RepID=G7E4A1_MIXOS|nr:uncharacterized protein L969DRAFT_87766 [Mixia osmundae IAM 14324]KEI39758.1 hypothetical protein L969DRAFT_87766 [Mixia osmundae IAM 14324]GAA97661.1 hypothetical protein E5Q_04339 [Mixia osmundae IAM 14324]
MSMVRHLVARHTHLALRARHMSKISVRPGDAKILSREPMELSEAKWVKLEKIQWKDQEGRERKWEVASRSTRKGKVDSVAIFATITAPKRPLSTVIILQYRPPIDAVIVELPAGLVDEGEEPEQSAMRELEEETGLKGTRVVDVSPVIVSDPGMTDANMSLATIEVNVDSVEELEAPQDKLEEGEHIEKRIVAIEDLYQTCHELTKQGCQVDARLYHLAWGLECAKRYSLSQSKSNEQKL